MYLPVDEAGLARAAETPPEKHDHEYHLADVRKQLPSSAQRRLRATEGSNTEVCSTGLELDGSAEGWRNRSCRRDSPIAGVASSCRTEQKQHAAACIAFMLMPLALVGACLVSERGTSSPCMDSMAALICRVRIPMAGWLHGVVGEWLRCDSV